MQQLLPTTLLEQTQMCHPSSISSYRSGLSWRKCSLQRTFNGLSWEHDQEDTKRTSGCRNSGNGWKVRAGNHQPSSRSCCSRAWVYEEAQYVAIARHLSIWATCAVTVSIDVWFRVHVNRSEERHHHCGWNERALRTQHTGRKNQKRGSATPRGGSASVSLIRASIIILYQPILLSVCPRINQDWAPELCSDTMKTRDTWVLPLRDVRRRLRWVHRVRWLYRRPNEFAEKYFAEYRIIQLLAGTIAIPHCEATKHQVHQS